ncbi:MAG: hypothetical protein MJZ16_04710 [Bacteroidales bacterium]|nr:hypothetical protein [Bacteroidales bacterium]
MFDKFCLDYGIGQGEKLASWSVSLSESLHILKRLSSEKISDVMSWLDRFTMADGFCNRQESIMLQAVNSILKGEPSEVLSMPLHNLPSNTGRIIYLENKKRGSANSILSNEEAFEQIDAQARLGGFHIIYIPRFAKHFETYSDVNDLARVVSLVSPAHTKEQMTNTITILRHMSTSYFYQSILKEKLGFPLDIDNPVWLVRLVDDVVDGKDYANFLVLEVARDVKSQIKEFVSGVNSRIGGYPIMVNVRKDSGRDFQYTGFYKAILDIMSIKAVDRWSVRIRTYGDGVDLYKDPETGKKTAVTIVKDGKEYPVHISGRDAAFYLLLLCESVSQSGGVDFSDMRAFRKIQSKYEYLYQKVSRRSIDGETLYQKCPDVTAPQTRIPMKSRVITALKSTPLTEQSLYYPQEKAGETMYIPLEAERVSIVTIGGEYPLAKSSLYNDTQNL